MDELQLLREALPEPQGPSPLVIARGRARLTSNRKGIRRRGAWTAGLVATAVAVTVFVAAVGWGGSADRLAPYQRMTAQQLLLAAATTSERLPSTTGRYWHAEIRNTPELLIVEDHGIRYRLHMTGDQTNAWIARSPADLSWYMTVSPLTFRGVTSADEAAWRHDGSPTVFIRPKIPAGPMPDVDDDPVRPWPPGKPAPPGQPVIGYFENAPPSLYIDGPHSIYLGESHHKVSVHDVTTLPTDPARLKTRLQSLLDPNRLKDTGRTPTEGMYDAVRDLLILAPAPPKVRAAAFRLLATLPGIKSLGKVRDPLGREGIGLIVTAPSYRPGGSYQDRFILDPATSKILALGNQTGPGNQNTYTAVITGWTNTSPPRPARAVPDDQP
jgi:hypothetical protein